MINELLLSLNACNEARIWAKEKSWQEIFTTCHRGDWLLWLFRKTMIDTEDNLKLLTRTKAHCALTVRHLMKDKRSINACEVALKYSDGLATKQDLRAAAYAAAYAAYADAAYAAAYAAYADAAYAAAYTDAAYANAAYADAADAADAAAYAAYAAAYADAADADAADAARIKSQKETADICRKYLPIEVWNIKED
jgi:hypothetical protein